MPWTARSRFTPENAKELVVDIAFANVLTEGNRTTNEHCAAFIGNVPIFGLKAVGIFKVAGEAVIAITFNHQRETGVHTFGLFAGKQGAAGHWNSVCWGWLTQGKLGTSPALVNS